MEALQLDERVLFEADDGIARVGGVEHIVVDGFGGRADAVHTANTLHQARGIPRAIVIDDDVGAVQVDALGQHVASDDDIVVVAVLALIVGIEVGADVLPLALSVAGTYREDVGAMQPLAQLFGQVVDGVHTLAEDHQLALLVALRVEELALQHLDEEVQFGVGIHLVPPLAESAQQVGVVLQHRQELGPEVGGAEGYLVRVVALGHRQLQYCVQFHPVGLQLLDVQVGGDNHLVLAEHLYHPFGGTQQRVQRLLEGIETAFQAFDHVGLVDAGQRVGHVFGRFAGWNLV